MTPEVIASLTTAAGTLVLAVATLPLLPALEDRWFAAVGQHWAIDTHTPLRT